MSDVRIDFKVMAQQANAQLQNMNSNIKNVAEQTSTARLALANVAGAAIIGGFKLVGNAISGLTSSMAENIKLAQIQEEAVNDLNVALKGAGKFSEEASKELQAYASELQNSSTFGDEAILKAQALGVQMAKLSGEDLKDATKAAANMASALNLDLNTAMRMIAKASQDGGSGLKRYGVEVEQSSDKSKTLANAIEAVNKQFSGAAAGKVNTFQGAVTQTQNSFGDLREEIGMMITQSPALVKVIGFVNTTFQDLGKWVKDNQDVVQNWIKNGVVLAIKALGYIVENINPVINGVKFLAKSFQILKNVTVLVFNGMAQTINGVLFGIIKTFANTITSLNEKFDVLVPDGLVEKLNNLKDAFSQTQSDMMKDTEEAADALGNSWKGLGQVFVDTVSKEKVDALLKKLKETEKSVLKSRKKVVKENKKLNNTDLKEQESYYGGLKGFVGEYQSFEKSTQQQRVDNMKSTLSSISSLTSSNNKTLFRIGQAAAVSTATIDGIAGVQKALASAPPPFNFVLAGLVGTAAALNVAKIASTKPPQYKDGGIIPGTSTYGDRTPALVNSGEMILNRSQQTQLFDIANGGATSNNNNLINAINGLGDRISNMEIVLMSDDIEIGRSVNRALDQGFVLASN